MSELFEGSELKAPLWYSPHVKIYSIGGAKRIAEISTYPRAYKDTDPHVYTEDTPFVEDLNSHYGVEAIQVRGSQQREGVREEESFPLWIESDDLPFTPVSNELHTFPCDGLPYPIYITRAYVNKGREWIELPANIAKSIEDQIAQLKKDGDVGVFRGRFSFPKAENEPPKILVRFCYERRFR
ncbi:hypothetical protein ES703_99415 [subsurface metagenome]